VAAITRGSSARSTPVSGAFTSSLAGTVSQTPEPRGAIVDLAMRVNGRVHGRMRVRIAGVPVAAGGLSMTGSQVDLALAGQPSVLQGRIVSLQGEEFDARLSGVSGTTVDVHAQLQIDSQNNTVTGTLSGSPVGP
jgi:hypothetical protein